MEEKPFYHDDVLRAVELVVFGRVSDAENLLVARDDCFSRCGFAILKCVQALLSGKPHIAPYRPPTPLILPSTQRMQLMWRRLLAAWKTLLHLLNRYGPLWFMHNA